jgi:hypothetical protein
MKAYEGEDVHIDVFLTSALVGGEWSASSPCRFIPLDRRLDGPQSLSGQHGEGQQCVIKTDRLIEFDDLFE